MNSRTVTTAPPKLNRIHGSHFCNFPVFETQEVRGDWLPFSLFIILFLQRQKATCTGPVQTHLHLHVCESSNCVEQQHRLRCIDVALSSNDQYAPIHKKD